MRSNHGLDGQDWYDSLAKPSWISAPAIIGLIWQILYPIIAVSFGFVFMRAIRYSSRCSDGLVNVAAGGVG